MALVPTANSDLEALKIGFDTNHNNLLDSGDTQWSSFKVWQDLNQDGITTSDEVMTLGAAGIVSINLVSDGVLYKAASDSVTVLGQASFTRGNGSTGRR